VESDRDLSVTVTIQAGKCSYDVLIAEKLLNRSGSAIAERLSKSKCAIISDENVASRYGQRVSDSLLSGGFQLVLITIPAGEQSKTLNHAEIVCDQMLEAGLDRHSFVIGLGGGVVGDLSGFVAAIFQRGIPHVQIPTTLLAMVDSSIGGKTGVNTALGKNMVGAVHHPRLVIDDIDVLKTLPRRELNQGFAEIIKHAIIADAEMFTNLHEMDASKLDRFNRSSLRELIQRNIEIKARFVAKDELDRTGDRALLNFGHTVAHGIERAGDYREILHGEAVGLGIVVACAISKKKAGLPSDQHDAIVDLLKKFELPTRLPENISREKILAAIKFDKKFERGEIRFVITPKIGSAHLSRDITFEDIREAVEAL
jgi:3-dehydroquinate synthase